MRINIFIVCFFIILSGCYRGQETTNEKTAPEYETCGIAGTNMRLCEVSQITLLGQPQNYDGKNVTLVAYLALDQGRLAIYPSKEFFVAGDRASSIELDAAYDRLKETSHRFAFQYVYIRGLFERHKGLDGNWESRFGRIRKALVTGVAVRGIEDKEQLDPDIKVGDWEG